MQSCKRTLLLVLIIFKIEDSKNFEDNNDDDFFVVQNSTSGNQICVTNSSSALTWNIPMNYKTDMVSKFIPTTGSSFDCNIENDNCTNNYWAKGPWRVVQHASDGKVKGPILDRRWENISRYHYSSNSRHTPDHVFDLVKSSFEIFWSLRTKCGAGFYLVPSKKKELRVQILLQNCSKNFTTIKNCHAKSMEKTGTLCEGMKGKRRLFRDLLDENQWKHFKLVKANSKLSLFFIEKEMESLIVEFENSSNLLNASYDVSIYSQFESLWKFHHYKYLYSDEKATVTLGPVFVVRSQTVCISMFVALCPTCGIKLSIINSSLPCFEKQYEAKQPFSWEEITFNVSRPELKGLTFNLNVTTFLNGTGAGFWAIDAVRECQKEEFRSLELPQSLSNANTSCQLLSYKDRIIKFPASGGLAEAKSNCSEGRVGKFCVPCSWISGRNDSFKLKFFEENKTFCSSCISSDDSIHLLPMEKGNVQNNSFIVIMVASILFCTILILVTIYFYRNHKNIWTRRAEEGVNFNNPNSGTTSTLGIHNFELTTYQQEMEASHVRIVDFEQYVHKLVDEGFGEQLKLHQGIKPKEQLSSSATIIEPPNVFYMDGYKVQRAFMILAKNQVTAENFWKIIWRENVQNVVFLTDNNTELAETYWPTTKKKRFGKLTVTLNSERHTQRTYEVQAKSDKRKVVRLHGVLGPDHTPALSKNLPALLGNILKISLDPKSPILLHCSSLLGKAEAVVLCDTTLRMAANEGSVDIPKLFQSLNFSQPINQDLYKVSHFAILDCFLHFEGTLTRDELLSGVGDFVKLQIRYLANLIRSEGVEVANNLYESYYSTISNNDAFTLGGTTFICMKEPENRTNFWTFVNKTDIKTVVSLNQTHLHVFQEGKCTVGETQCRHVQTKESKWHKSTIIELKNKQSRKRVEVLCCNDWQDDEPLPRDVPNFVKFFEKSLLTKSNSTILVCQDGVTATGVYLALVLLVEKINENGICDVPNAIRAVRRDNDACFGQDDQIAFLYRVLKEYTIRGRGW